MEGMDFPLAISAMDLQIHMAPRVLRWNSAYSQATAVYSSILAGAKTSNSYARVVLYDMLEQAHLAVPGSVREFVDDLAQTGRGASPASVRDKIITVATILVEKIKEKGLRISPKTTMVTSMSWLAKQIIPPLRRLGIPISCARNVRDLGLDCGGGGTRTVAVRDARTKKGKGRTAKVKKMIVSEQ